MNIVYFGSDVHYVSFCYLMENHNIMALYTYHNDEDFFTEYKIVKTAKENNIPVYYEAISEEAIFKYFNEDGCDLFFVAEYDKIIHIPSSLDNFCGVNIHLSLLPEGRSYYPIENAMHKGRKNAGVTIHRLVSHLDSGEIIFQEPIPIEKENDSVDIYIKAAKAAFSMTKKLMTDFEMCFKNATVQVGEKEYWKRPESAFLMLRHDLSLESAKEMVRTFNKMTEVRIDDKAYYVSSAVFSTQAISSETIQISDNMFLYGVNGGHIRLTVCEKSKES